MNESSCGRDDAHHERRLMHMARAKLLITQVRGGRDDSKAGQAEVKKQMHTYTRLMNEREKLKPKLQRTAIDIYYILFCDMNRQLKSAEPAKQSNAKEGKNSTRLCPDYSCVSSSKLFGPAGSPTVTKRNVNADKKDHKHPLNMRITKPDLT